LVLSFSLPSMRETRSLDPALAVGNDGPNALRPLQTTVLFRTSPTTLGQTEPVPEWGSVTVSIFPGIEGIDDRAYGSGMTDNDPDRRMTIPELLKARAVIRGRLEAGTGGAPIRAGASGWNHSARDILLAELQEVEAELAEQGYKNA
jgi:hypothetical protein